MRRVRRCRFNPIAVGVDSSFEALLAIHWFKYSVQSDFADSLLKLHRNAWHVKCPHAQLLSVFRNRGKHLLETKHSNTMFLQNIFFLPIFT